MNYQYSGTPPKNSYLSDKKDILATYADWSNTYEQEYYNEQGNRIPYILSDLFAQYVPLETKASVLDAGAGTGYLGKVLREKGFNDLGLHAVDLSEDMLSHVEEKDIYTSAMWADLEELPFKENMFDHCISSAVIGLVPATVFSELIRVTKPGGYILFNLRDQYYESGEAPFKKQMEALESSGAWEIVAQQGPEEVFANPHFHALYYFFVYKVR